MDKSNIWKKILAGVLLFMMVFSVFGTLIFSLIA